MIPKFTEDIFTKWRIAQQGFHNDKEWYASAIHIRESGNKVIPDIHDFLIAFIDGRIAVDEFRETFDRKTRKEWTFFGLKGLSGAMLLNMFVKHIPDKPLLTDQLRLVVRVPKNPSEGQEKLKNFSVFIEKMLEIHHIKRRYLQPQRIPYLISGFWHFQSPNDWPFFYVSTRTVFERDGIYSPVQNSIEDYFQFREIYLGLTSKLGITFEELDDVSEWRHEREVKSKIPLKIEEQEPSTPQLPPAKMPEVDKGDIRHTHVQWLLAKIGKKMGYSIWIASNDRNKIFQEESLGSLSIQSMPLLFVGEIAQKNIQLIDVIWLDGTREVVAAFEVERTTSIYSGLLRLSDLVTETPNSIFPVYIVTPEERLKDVKKELCRPTFKDLGLADRCGFFSDKILLDNFDSIIKFATDKSAIDSITSRVDCE